MYVYILRNKQTNKQKQEKQRQDYKSNSSKKLFFMYNGRKPAPDQVVFTFLIRNVKCYQRFLLLICWCTIAICNSNYHLNRVPTSIKYVRYINPIAAIITAAELRKKNKIVRYLQYMFSIAGNETVII